MANTPLSHSAVAEDPTEVPSAASPRLAEGIHRAQGLVSHRARALVYGKGFVTIHKTAWANARCRQAQGEGKISESRVQRIKTDDYGSGDQTYDSAAKWESV